jgi:hypothetical protein
MLRAARWAGWAVLVGLLIRDVLARGPLSFAAPASVVSHAVPVMRGSEPYLLLLKAARRRLPKGATIAVVSPPDAGSVPYLLAVGQLPGQTVLGPHTLDPAADAAPDWVVSVGTPFRDPRFELEESFPAGALFRRRP